MRSDGLAAFDATQSDIAILDLHWHLFNQSLKRIR
jgi:hypothetical protein